MTNDNLYSVPKWRIGELSTGWYSREEILDLAQSFVHTELFLDAVEYLLEMVVDVFELRLVSEEGLQSFLELSTHAQRNEVFHITSRLEVLYLAWQLASDLNPAVASFQGDTLQKLRAEICLLNADCDGDTLQKVKAAMISLRDINSAFARVNRELGIHRAKYDLAGRVSGEKGDEQIPAEVAQDPPPPVLAHVVHHDSTVLGPSGEDNPSKGLNAEVEPTPDANCQTITKPATPPVLFKSNRKGVSLQDAAIAVNDEAPELWLATKKRWQQDHRKHFLPTPIGKAESHSQMDLYDLNELCDAIAKLETHEQAEFCRKRLKFKLQDITEIVFKPSGPPASFDN